MKKNQHQGKILETFLKKNGYNLSELSRKLYISRTTFYRKLKQQKLSFDFVSAISRAIDYSLLSHMLEEGEVVSLFNRKEKPDIVRRYIAALERQLALLQMSTDVLIEEVKKSKKKNGKSKGTF